MMWGTSAPWSHLPIYNYIHVHFLAMQLLVSIVSAVMIQGCYVLDLVHDRALHM